MHHRLTARRAVAAALLALTPLVAAACGDDETDAPASSVTTVEAMTEDSMKEGDAMTEDSMKDDGK